MLSRTAITAALSIATLASGAASQLRASERYEIAAERLVEAVQARGVQVEPQQVSLLASVTASEAAPKLRIAGMKKLGSSEAAVRFACESSAVCVPFYALVRGLSGEQLLLISQTAGGQRPRPAALEKPCIRSGDRASLIIENPEIRITLPVIALQNGRIGETIRATDTERKRFYRAEVSGPGLLKGAL